MTYEDLYVDEKTAYCFIQKLNKFYKHKFDEILDAENENFSKINFSISLKIFRKESKNDSESTYEELAAYSFRDISIINHDLRSYQIKGKDWLISKDLGIMADDMGLGKTVQTIKAIETLLINSEIILFSCKKNRIFFFCFIYQIFKFFLRIIVMIRKFFFLSNIYIIFF